MSQNTSLSDFFDDCTICYTSSTNSPVVATLCNHRFHYECLVNQVQTNGNCPVCRTEIAPETLTALLPQMTDIETLIQKHSTLESELASLRQSHETLSQKHSTLQRDVELLCRSYESLSQSHGTLQRQTLVLRDQIRVLEDVLSVRIQQNEPEQEQRRRVATRSSTAQQAQQNNQVTTSTSTVSAPSSVRRTGRNSLLMRKWRVFRSQRTFLLRNRHPDISGRAIQEMVRKEWSEMTPEQKNAVQL